VAELPGDCNEMSPTGRAVLAPTTYASDPPILAMTKPLRLLLALAGVVAVALLVWFARSRKGDASGAKAAPVAERVVPVLTATVTQSDVPIVLEGLGTVTPLATVTLRSQVEGRLEKVLFTEGQAVKKGDVLAQIDARPFLAQQAQTAANLARDKAQLDGAHLQLARLTELRKSDLAPQQDLDTQRATVAALTATVAADRAQQESAALQVGYARVVAPIDGITGLRQVDPGNLVRSSDANGIVVVTQIDPIAVLFSVPQDEWPRLSAEMAKGKLGVDAYGRDGTTKLATGELLLVDNQVNAQTSTLTLKATFANPMHVLWPNAFVKARLTLATQRGVRTVPAQAIQRSSSGAYVYVVEAGNVVALKNVEVSSIERDVAILASGLNAGEVVVIEGQNQLKPGGKVAPRGGATGRP